MSNVYSVVAWKSPVGEGATGARHVELRGYAKANSADYPYTLANELLASRIGQVLGLPIPPGAVIQGEQPDTKGWLTLSFSPQKLPPADPTEVVADLPRLAAGVFVFDVLIVNQDRHCGNLAYRSKLKRMDAFDHSHSLFGVRAGEIDDRLKRMKDEFAVQGNPITGELTYSRHCLLDHLSEAKDILFWVDEIEALLKDRLIERWLEEVVDLDVGLDQPDASRMRQFLSHRRANLRKLILDNQSEFGSVPAKDWGLV